ncbi:MAG: PEP-CTERM sorting domain-containing protein [Cyclobacteriaceae bacterium]|nr:PEP-CTERM sorting domain-containing protein [Cyclobacteriaceae bacterium]
MKKRFIARLATGLFIFGMVGTAQAAFILDFEGLADQEQILDFYNGGTGGNGSNSGTNYGIGFGSNALALIDADAGGSGNFGGEPSPDTVMFFLTGSAILNKEDGFDTGFSFSYSAINNPGSVLVYDGHNATGNVLANISLPVTNSDGGDPTGAFSPFYNAGSAFSGTAKSIDFGGTVNQIGFDDITFNSATPGVETDLPFLVGDVTTNPEYNSRTTAYFLNDDSSITDFDPNASTYIITHGWQPSVNYANDDYTEFNHLNMPESQFTVIEAIKNRLLEENSADVNIITFEWEGAYTGELSVTNPTATRRARTNADYAGVLLGGALTDILGEDYDEDLHFISHSYGTIVNGLATRYLENLSYLDDADTVQFTILDSPTIAITNLGAPNFDADWFENNLSENVDYLDNYYGSLNLWGLGEPLDGAGLNQHVNYGHSDVFSKFYPDLIELGPDANTDPNDSDIGKFAHGFEDWITPMLSTYNDRPGNDFSNAGADQFLVLASADYTSVLGIPIVVDSLTGDLSSYSFNGLFLEEQSPVSVFYDLDIPLWADSFAFDWMVEDAGDGDWFTVYFGNELFLSMSISESLEGMLFQEQFGISDYAGMEKQVYFTLNSVGEANASLYVGNLEYRGANPVPEPTTIFLLSLGLLGLAGVRKKKSHK